MNQHDQPMNRIVDICWDDAEVLALSILRFMAAGYMTSDVACWDAAYDTAERVLGPVEGPQLVAAMTAIMRAIRRERDGDWCFMPATCYRATADELQLISLLGSARRGLHADLREKAEALTGGQPAPCLCASVVAAANRLNAVQSHPTSGSGPTDSAAIH